MIMFWNQREVFAGFSMEKLSEVRGVLGANNIAYKYKVVNLGSSNRSRTGTLGMNMDYANEYYVYVHKKDYTRALSALRNS
ncbi:MAG: hypothetical protein Q8930_16355 [Bacillota bacterium]|nr:hypothetical protein [Bacillota bacterium]